MNLNELPQKFNPLNNFKLAEIGVTPTVGRLLNDSTLLLIPKLANSLGGTTSVYEAILLQQLHYSLCKSGFDAEYAAELGIDCKFVAKSCQEWSYEFPFISQDTVKRVFAKLKTKKWILSKGAIFPFKGENGIYKKRTTLWTINDARYESSNHASLPRAFIPGLSIPISPFIAKKLGFHIALILQQAHYGSRKGKWIEGKRWMVKTIHQWQTDLLPCISVDTIKRAIKKAESLNLLISRDHVCSDTRVKAYRIDYSRLADTLQIKLWSTIPH